MGYNGQIPPAELLPTPFGERAANILRGAGSFIVKAATSMGNDVRVPYAMPPHQPTRPRPETLAEEFARVETLLQDRVERENFRDGINLRPPKR